MVTISFFRIFFVALLFATLTGCANGPKVDEGKTKLLFIGTVHQGHIGSKLYSLDRLEGVIRKFDPDQVLTEIPPDRVAPALAGFRETGRVTEERVNDFPEYRDMLFPLSRDLDFEIVGVAAWTPKIAADRTATLARIQRDPASAQQWAEYQAALKAFSQDIAGRADDPAFIHTPAYDSLSEKRQLPYQRYFDDDLGAGGWTQINAAHYELIDKALDRISGKGKTVVILFGATHKYKLLRELRNRDDIELVDPLPYFAD